MYTNPCHGIIEIFKTLCRIPFRKPEGKRPLGRTRCGWEDDVKLEFKEICYGGVD
jgi:hypothetical protein